MSHHLFDKVKIAEIRAESDKAISLGPFGSSLNTNHYTESGVPVIRGMNLDDGRFHDDDFVFVPNLLADKYGRSVVYPDDIVFTYKGTIGQVGIIPRKPRYERYIISPSHLKLTVDRRKADPLFVYYFFKSEIGQQLLLANSSPTGTPGIIRPTKTLAGIEMPYPSLSEQGAIAHVLSILDDKIELNPQMNETLESIARAIFKSWFIDFDPVRAKMQRRKPFGMGEETAALFPDSFAESELGEIPNGWKIDNLGNILVLEYGKALREDLRNPGMVPVFGSNGQVGWHDKSLVKGPGIIVGRKGNPGLITWSHTDFYPIDTTFYIVPRLLGRCLHFLFYSLEQQKLGQLNADSAVPGLNRNHAYLNKIILPPLQLIRTFEELVSPLCEKIFVNDKESRNLICIRDALLPKLISGEIRIKPQSELGEV